MERILVVAIVVAAAVVVALVVERRRPDAPTQGDWPVPRQLDRADFDRADAPWLVAVFSSATCDSCATVVKKSAVLASNEVVVQDVEVGAKGDLHKRYGIEAVPTIVVADAEGVVRASFVGPPSATDLWAAVAEVREPGSSPEPELGQPQRQPQRQTQGQPQPQAEKSP
jgi:thioredoxin-like negative regulator of GroEL